MAKRANKRVSKQVEEFLATIGSVDTTLRNPVCRQFQAGLANDTWRDSFDTRVFELANSYCKCNEVEEVRNYTLSLVSDDGKGFTSKRFQSQQIKDALQEFAAPNHPNFGWNRNYRAAKQELMDLGPKDLRPIVYDSDESIINELSKLDTHAGFAYLETGDRHKGEHMSHIFSKYVAFEQEARKRGHCNRPMLAGRKNIVTGPYDEEGNETDTFKNKSRLVLMVDLYQIILEMKFSRPVQHYMGRTNWYAGGKSDRDIQDLILSRVHEGGVWMTFDYSSYDRSISDWLIRDAFDVLLSWFSPGAVDRKLWNTMVDSFVKKEILGADGIVLSEKGVPSGSMFTSIIDSVVNMLMINTYKRHLIGPRKDKRFTSIVMGDDNHVQMSYPMSTIFTSEGYSSYIKKNFGVTTNTKKEVTGVVGEDDPQFLSRTWTNFGPTRNSKVLITKMLYPEGYRNYDAGCLPELIFYAYFLAYPVSVRETFDIPRFLSNYPNLRDYTTAEKLELVSHYLPGSLAYRIQYENVRQLK